MLYGRRQPLSQIRRWLEGQRLHPILVVHGSTGCGKTLAVSTLIKETNLDPLYLDELDRLRQTISLSRSPKSMTDQPFPLVMISDNHNDIDRDISSRAFSVKIDTPSKHHLLDLLNAECEKRNLAHSQAILGTIAGSAHSYRSALNALNTTPPTADIDELESRRPAVTGSAQSEAILKGQWIGDFSVHPLSILNMAEWNSADPKVVARGLMLHSRSWAADGLGPVSRAYLRTIRTATHDRPPFRDRQIRGSVRR